MKRLKRDMKRRLNKGSGHAGMLGTARRGTASFLALVIPALSLAGDWPQIMGPQRDGVAEEETLLLKWPGTGPEKAWQIEAGQGFSAPVVQGNTLVLYHRPGTDDRVEAFAADTGKSIWQRSFPSSYRGGINPDSGPRATPVIHQGRVYTISAEGRVACLDLDSGEQYWQRELGKETRAPEGYFGMGSSPIIADGKLLFNLGAKKAGIVALDLASGKTAWQVTDHAASYSAPIAARLGERNAVIFITRYVTMGLEPSSGERLFSIPFGMRGPTVNAALPLLIDQRLFLTASYRVGAAMYEVNETKTRKVWARDDALSSQYTSAVYHAGYIFGTHGREDIPPAHLRCIEARTGKVQWSKDNHGVTHLIRVGDHLLALTIEGRLSLIEASAEAYKELAAHRISKETTRSFPALSRGRLLVRGSNDGSSGTLSCFVVGKP
jgi:outer membrane protein assembly factor BamB